MVSSARSLSLHAGWRQESDGRGWEMKRWRAHHPKGSGAQRNQPLHLRVKPGAHCRPQPRESAAAGSPHVQSTAATDPKPKHAAAAHPQNSMVAGWRPPRAASTIRCASVDCSRQQGSSCETGTHAMQSAAAAAAGLVARGVAWRGVCQARSRPNPARTFASSRCAVASFTARALYALFLQLFRCCRYEWRFSRLA